MEHKIEYYSNGNKQVESYYENGEFHNLNGPARIWYYENGNKTYEVYWINGKHHNLNGPAIIWYFENGNKQYEQYYLFDIEIPKENYYDLIESIDVEYLEQMVVMKYGT